MKKSKLHLKIESSDYYKNNTLKIFFVIFILTFISYSCKKNKLVEIETQRVTSIDMTSAKSGGKFINTGDELITAKGVCWSKKSNPTIKDFYTFDGDGSDSFVSEIKNLEPNSTYYVRAYATSDAGTSYGNEIKFSTSDLVTLVFRNVYFNVYPVDNSLSSTWGITGLFCNAVSDYNGLSNTQLISSMASSSAAKICANLNALGYSDWYLPSRNELNQIYENKHLFPAENFGLTYWSSTEFNDQRAYSQNFSVGETSIVAKSSHHRVRCIREVKK